MIFWRRDRRQRQAEILFVGPRERAGEADGDDRAWMQGVLGEAIGRGGSNKSRKRRSGKRLRSRENSERARHEPERSFRLQQRREADAVLRSWRLGQVADRSNLRDVRGTRDRDIRTARIYRWQRLLALYGRLTRTEKRDPSRSRREKICASSRSRFDVEVTEDAADKQWIG